MQNKRILIIGTSIPSVGGGLGYFLLSAVLHLANKNHHYDFYVVVPSSFKDFKGLNIDNIHVEFWDNTYPRRQTEKFINTLTKKFETKPQNIYLIGNAILSTYLPFGFVRKAWGNIHEIFVAINPDAIWIPHYPIGAPQFLSIKANLLNINKPIIFTIHDIHPVIFPDDWTQSSLESFNNEFKEVTRKSKTIITHTKYQKELIIKHLEIDPQKIKVIPIPPLIDLTLFQKRTSLDDDIRRIFLDKKIPKKYILYPGSTTHSHKNHLRLLLAWKELSKILGEECPSLICTAKGHMWPAINALVQVLNLEGIVTFTDTVDTKCLIYLIQNSLLVVVPTLYEGGGSGPVVDALMCGKIVACSNIPPIVEHLEACDNPKVEFFNPNSVDSIVATLVSCIHDFEVLNKFTEENRQKIINKLPQLWEEWSNFYSEEFRELLASGE
jgi:glycosyltransferase involved in cell wall biosynthesis